MRLLARTNTVSRRRRERETTQSIFAYIKTVEREQSQRIFLWGNYGVELSDQPQPAGRLAGCQCTLLFRTRLRSTTMLTLSVRAEGRKEASNGRLSTLVIKCAVTDSFIFSMNKKPKTAIVVHCVGCPKHKVEKINYRTNSLYFYYSSLKIALWPIDKEHRISIFFPPTLRFDVE